MTIVRFFLLMAFVVLALPACQSLDERRDARKLEQTLATYATAVRWQPPSALYGFLDPKLQPDTLPPGLDNVRVTGYDVTVAPREISKDQVTQSALIEYVLVDRQSVRSLVDNQLWQRSPEGGWQRANPIPDFR